MPYHDEPAHAPPVACPASRYACSVDNLDSQTKVQKFLAVIAVVSLLHGCSSQPKTALPKPIIKTIAVIPATNPAQLTFANESALQFLIPLAATANYVDSKEKALQFNERFRLLNADLAQELTESMVASLRAQGYTVDVLADVLRPKESPDNVDYKKMSTNADAILHLSYSDVGLHSPRSSTSYLPRMNVSGVLLVKGRDDYLYDSYVYYGVDARNGKPWAIESDLDFSYPSFDAVMSNLVKIKSQFTQATSLISKRMATQIHDAIQ